jgi:hypothetical protein
MATVKSYVEAHIVDTFRIRYEDFFVAWANALLERLSGAGILPPQRVTRGTVVRNGVWVDKPPMCRDVLGLRRAGDEVGGGAL